MVTFLHRVQKVAELGTDFNSKALNQSKLVEIM